MPKGFTEREKELIRGQLLEKGRECLETYGVRKTNVEDLTRAAGISKGAFYIFFTSKEELFLEVLERAEAELRARLFDCILQPGQSSRQSFKELLKNAFIFWDSTSLLSKLDQEEFTYMVRKLPEERVKEHVHRDEVFISQLMERWESAGVSFSQDPKIVSGLMKALFFASLHRDDIGKDAYPGTMELLIDLIAERLIEA